MDKNIQPVRYELAYAENRCQSPAFLIHGETNDPLAMRFFDIVSGGPSYISFADGHTILNILCLLNTAFRENHRNPPFIAIVGKHGNPCGAAFSWNSPEIALTKALFGNPVAAMGGELITNFLINENLGEVVFYSPKGKIGRDKWGLDILLAPEFSAEAIELLGKREKRRLLANEALKAPFLPKHPEVIQILRGGDQLIQQAPNFILNHGSIIDRTGKSALPDAQHHNLLLAWAIAWRATSNTVALVKDNTLIGLGCGRQDRIDCTRLCIDQAINAGHKTEGSIFASDGFFPFANGNLPSIADIVELGSVKNKNLDWPTYKDNSRSAIRKIDKIIHQLQKLDKREAAELLIDAGCIGGVVPADGIRLEEVKKLFTEAGLNVAFVAPENRGFSRH